jgi:hypothetical protein
MGMRKHHTKSPTPLTHHQLSSSIGKINVSKGSGNAITDMLSFFSGVADDDSLAYFCQLAKKAGPSKKKRKS